MKRFTKGCLIAAAVSSCLGIAFCITGAILGVNAESMKKAKLSWGPDSYYEFLEGEDLTDVRQSFDKVKKLEIHVDAGNVIVEESDVDKITVIGETENISIKEQKGDTLVIEDSNKSRFFLGQYNSNILVQIPKGTKFEKLDLEIGAGKLQMYDFYTENLRVECGAGNMTLQGTVTGESDLHCGMGLVSFSGNLKGNTKVECGMGSTTLKLKNQEDDFNYDLECGIGNIELGDHVSNGFGSTKKIDKNADADMRVQCGMGSVKIVFEK